MTKEDQLEEFAKGRLLVHFYQSPGQFIGYGHQWDQLWTDFVKYYNTGHVGDWGETQNKLMLKVKIEIHEYYDTYIR